MSQRQQVDQLIPLFKKKIVSTTDPGFIRRKLENSEAKDTLGKWGRGLATRGLEGLTEDRQYVYVSNHNSHFDYAIHFLTLGWHWLSKTGEIRPTLFAAGKNLDQPVLRRIGLDFSRLGSVWIDREFISSDAPRVQRCAYGEALTQVLSEEMLKRGRDIFFYGPGGRNYKSQKPAALKPWLFNFLADLPNPERIALVPTAIRYTERIEEPVINEIAKAREEKTRLGRTRYFALDGGMFAVAYAYGWSLQKLSQISTLLGLPPVAPPNRYMATSFGIPIPLEEVYKRNSSRGGRKDLMLNLTKEGIDAEYKRAVEDLNQIRKR